MTLGNSRQSVPLIMLDKSFQVNNKSQAISDMWVILDNHQSEAPKKTHTLKGSLAKSDR